MTSKRTCTTTPTTKNWRRKLTLPPRSYHGHVWVHGEAYPCRRRLVRHVQRVQHFVAVELNGPHHSMDHGRRVQCLSPKLASARVGQQHPGEEDGDNGLLHELRGKECHGPIVRDKAVDRVGRPLLERHLPRRRPECDVPHANVAGEKKVSPAALQPKHQNVENYGAENYFFDKFASNLWYSSMDFCAQTGLQNTTPEHLGQGYNAGAARRRQCQQCVLVWR
jgi:hypothetical protein